MTLSLQHQNQIYKFLSVSSPNRYQCCEEDTTFSDGQFILAGSNVVMCSIYGLGYTLARFSCQLACLTPIIRLTRSRRYLRFYCRCLWLVFPYAHRSLGHYEGRIWIARHGYAVNHGNPTPCWVWAGCHRSIQQTRGEGVESFFFRRGHFYFEVSTLFQLNFSFKQEPQGNAKTAIDRAVDV